MITQLLKLTVLHIHAGLIKSLENEKEELGARSKTLAVDEAKMSAERASLLQEKEFVHKEQERLTQLATTVRSEMNGIDTLSKVDNQIRIH